MQDRVAALPKIILLFDTLKDIVCMNSKDIQREP